jgi:hypothetical protein
MFEFIHNVRNNKIIINGDDFDLEDFLEVVPDYNTTDSLRSVHYIPGKKHTIDIDGVITPKPVIWNLGDFYISKHNDLKLYISHKNILEEETEQKKEKKTSPDNSYDVNRKIEYPTTDELIVALWEGLIEKSSSGQQKIKELESLRKSVKNRFPKT